MRVPSLVLVVIVAAHSMPAPARAQGSNEEDAASDAGYRALIEEAVTEFDREGFREARALFERAHELSPNARTLRGIGLASFELRDYPAAHRALTAALTHPSRPLTSAQQEEVRALLVRTARFIGVYRVRLTPPSASITVDGAEVALTESPLVLSLGAHELRARADDHHDVSSTVVVSGGESRELILALEPIEAVIETEIETEIETAATVRPRAPRAVASPGRDDAPWIVLVATGGVFAGASLVVGIASWWTRDVEIGRCVAAGPRCDNLGTLETERDAAAGATIALAALGGAAIVVAAIALGSSEPSPSRAFSCAPAGAGLVCNGRF